MPRRSASTSRRPAARTDETDAADDPAECEKVQLQIPMTSEIIQRRNYILDLMKTRSEKSGGRHAPGEYEAAKQEVAVIKEQVAATWRAAHFVWQVREALAQVLCPDTPDDCTEVDTGGYRVTTTLDWDMQKIAEKYVYAAARAPHAKDVRAVLKARKIPTEPVGLDPGPARPEHPQRGRRRRGLPDRRGPGLCRQRELHVQGTKKFQPKFDVLADGWRQPGSSIKPIDYLIGIDDKTITASTMFMDVATNFGKGFVPTQADKLERGPVRLRSALQFSLNVPAIKATIISGLDHVWERTKDFGLTYPSTATPVLSEGIGTLETHPIDMVSAYATIANGGVHMPRQTILKVVNDKGTQTWPIDDTPIKGEKVVSKQAAYIITDILAGNTDRRINPYWGEWAVYKDGRRRPAAYKTGTTSDNRDVHAYGYLAPPEGQGRAGPRRRRLDGQQQQRPQQGQPLARLVRAALVGHPRDRSARTCRSPRSRPRAGSRARPSTPSRVSSPVPSRRRPSASCSCRAPSRTRRRRSGSRSTSTRRPGCSGRTAASARRSRRASSISPRSRATSRPGRRPTRRGPPARPRAPACVARAGTRTSYFYLNSFAPFGRSWGAPFAPKETCPLAPPPCGVQPPDPDPNDDVPAPTPIPCPTPDADRPWWRRRWRWRRR